MTLQRIARGHREPHLFLILLFVSAFAAPANADFLITPFVGSEFGGNTTQLQFDPGAASTKHWTFGASAAWLSDEILGLEADLGTIPAFFESGEGLGLVTGSRVTTLSGNVIAAVPLAISRESLRPYVLAGLGLVHAAAHDIVDLNQGNDWPGLQLGGGAIGFISNRAGVRFDLRHTRALSRGTTLLGERTSRLSFWRATIGVTLRY